MPFLRKGSQILIKNGSHSDRITLNKKAMKIIMAFFIYLFLRIISISDTSQDLIHAL